MEVIIDVIVADTSAGSSLCDNCECGNVSVLVSEQLF